MPPSASEPESGSVIAQAPILSRVMRSSDHRCICAGVPNLLMVPAARPVETPREVSMPGLTRQSSIVEMSCAAGSVASRRLEVSPLSLRASWRSKLSRAISFSPNTEYILRKMS